MLRNEASIPKPSSKAKIIVAAAAFLFFALGLHGQEKIAGQQQIIEIRDILLSKNLVALQNKIKALRGADWKYMREVAPNFKEGVFFVSVIKTDSNSPSLSNQIFYKIDILVANESTIICYNVSEMKSKKVGKILRHYYEKTDSFKDAASYSSLFNSFKSVFHVDINEKELFMIDYVYGEHCDGKKNPKGKDKIEHFVKKENKKELLKWLVSVNTEKQVYAINGLFQLKLSGMLLTPDEKKIIDFVVNKEGNMQTCYDCAAGSMDIPTVTKEFKF